MVAFSEPILLTVGIEQRNPLLRQILEASSNFYIIYIINSLLKPIIPPIF
ncbi:MAG: hypothetical protein LBT10_02790 [Methanobrevibacter sp.]|jgi:hypothetical protein|nr:hypothetical protein [Methanobrevibacter sp.]